MHLVKTMKQRYLKTLKVITIPFLSLILSSCEQSTSKAMNESFTKWMSEDGRLMFYANYSKHGGNGKAFIDNEFQSFLWQRNGDEILCYFLETNTTASYEIKPSSKNTSNKAYLKGESESTPISGKETIKIFEDEFNETIDAKYCINTYFTNDELGLEFKYSLDFENKTISLNVTTGSNYTGIKLDFLENQAFSMAYDGKNAAGNYYTSKTNLLFTFKTNEIFDNDHLFFTLGEASKL